MTQGVRILCGPSGVAGGDRAQTGFGRAWVEVQSEPHPGQRIEGGVVPARRLSPAAVAKRIATRHSSPAVPPARAPPSIHPWEAP